MKMIAKFILAIFHAMKIIIKYFFSSLLFKHF